MNPVQPSASKNPNGQGNSGKACEHPSVRIVAREEDDEFVECQMCGEVFEASEFKDMTIEAEKLRREEA